MGFLRWLLTNPRTTGRATEAEYLLAKTLGLLEGYQVAPELQSEIRSYLINRGLLPPMEETP